MGKFTNKQKIKFALMAGFVFYSGFAFAQPINDNCSGAIGITPGPGVTCANSVSGSGLNALMSSTESDCSGIPTNDVWYSFVATSTSHKITLSNISPTNTLATYYEYNMSLLSGSCSLLTELNCGAGYEEVGFVPSSEILLIASNLTVGDTYYIQIAGDYAEDDNFDYIEIGINFNLCIRNIIPAPNNDVCANAIPLPTGVTTGNNESATDDIIPATPTCGSSTNGARGGVWYTFTPAATGNLTLSTCGSEFDTYLRVYSGTCGAFTDCIGSNDDGDDCGLTSELTIPVTANTTYYLLLGKYNALVVGGNYTITTTGTPLPVKMDKLSGELTSGNLAQLSWNTFAEQNNKGFEIQRSADGKTFTSAGFVSSKATAGNSSEQIGYSFTDRESISGAVYYRLQQTDIDGKTVYSNIVRLATKENGGFDVVVAPNPVKNNLTVNTYGVQGKEAKVYLADITGKIVRTVTVTGAETAVDMTGLPEGMYLVKYLDAEHNQTIKVSKQ